MYEVSHQQLDDVQDAIDTFDLVDAAQALYPSIAEVSGAGNCAQDVLTEIACDRHVNETVARFRDNPSAFLRSGEMIDIGKISAKSFAVLISALESVASTDHALDQMTSENKF